ncbi:hypothetical protein HPP92_019154 [Vanilla planifolia]|uniref:Uncharacterized protein n=1 Tax=Vanilla planifolia TaxID=51239 RepID=A0A835Q2D0_VANPL|nr:hypothetical protein HPP92_019154 [Vanilla planifolia]
MVPLLAQFLPDVADDISSIISTTTSSSLPVTGPSPPARSRSEPSACKTNSRSPPPCPELSPNCPLVREMCDESSGIALEHNVADGRCPHGGLLLRRAGGTMVLQRVEAGGRGEVVPVA